ncbi:41327_t:CDS:10 [Gigaspora margarita]|uniref:41327_t:CDS:1 n=1 Tax=Gigaspora margarita TaxID=4874 RepID=A0ABM8VYF8_GIGMA|nr:41327_t:CDS:10 [Gigaspora margarita]
MSIGVVAHNEPPLVPYQFPIIGHTYNFLRDAENFLKECKEKYGDPFSLYIFGNVVTFAGADIIPEVLKNSDVFDFYTGLNKIFPIHVVFKQFMKNYSSSYTARVVQEQISNKINIYTSRLQKELLSGIEIFFGNCNEPKIFKNIHYTMSLIISKPVANVILGECAQFDDIVASFALVEKEIQKMRYVPPILMFIHPSLHQFFVMLPLRFGWNPISRHRDLFVQRCKPIIEERIRQRKELGEKYIQKEDILDFYISESKTHVVDDNYLDNLFGELYNIVFASVSTTSRPELWNELYEEQLKIHNESNGNLSIEDVNKMVKLDCFVKESLRHSADIAVIPHTVMSDSFTFSNGITVPKDRDIYLYMKDSAFNNKFFGETSIDFQPKRHITSFANGKIVHSPATKVDKSFAMFGGGKRACPGRFFAINEIKMCLHKLILRYNIRTESGKIVPPKIKTSTYVPSDSGLIFENRNYVKV